MIDRQSGFGTFVCASCLEDEALGGLAHQQGMTRLCDYCGTTPQTSSVVPLDDVIQFMAKAIEEEWCDPVQTAPYCSAEGGYQIMTLANDELFEFIGFEVSNEQLMSDLLSAFGGHDWCERNWSIFSPSDRWASAWDRFERVIKHERRYTFWHSHDDGESPDHPDHLPPAHMLDELQAVINGARMIKELPVGTAIWRVRCHEGDKALATADDFTPPPIRFATEPNRMSPAGVPMFYGAADFQTAVDEVVRLDDMGKGKQVTGGLFTNLISLNVLDLTAIPARPSYFAPGGPFMRHRISFLRKFAKAMAQPIHRDGRAHIEYVPTQVFTEFVRHGMKGPQGIPIHGIRYASSKNGRDCYVLFVGRGDCLPASGHRPRPQMLQFHEVSLKGVLVP